MKLLATAIATLGLAGLAVAGPGYTPVPASPPPPVSTAPSSDISYTNIEAGWAHTWFHDRPSLSDADGAYLKFEAELVPHLYFTGGGSWNSVNSALGTTDLWLANGGLGGYITLANNFDLVGEAGALFYGIENGPLDVSKNDASFYAKPHFRWKPVDRIETQVGAIFADLDVVDQWSGFVNVYTGLTEVMDLATGFSYGDDTYVLRVGLRFNF